MFIHHVDGFAVRLLWYGLPSENCFARMYAEVLWPSLPAGLPEGRLQGRASFVIGAFGTAPIPGALSLMTFSFRSVSFALTAAVAVAALAGPAFAVSEKVEDACSDDYLRFCSQHSVGSNGLRRCMEANGRSLSRKCINALVDSGEIPRKYKR